MEEERLEGEIDHKRELDELKVKKINNFFYNSLYPTLIKPAFSMYHYQKCVLVVGTAKSAYCVWLAGFIKVIQRIDAGHLQYVSHCTLVLEYK